MCSDLVDVYFQLSVVEYDPSTHDLKTCSLHQFEEPELKVDTCLTNIFYLRKGTIFK